MDRRALSKMSSAEIFSQPFFSESSDPARERRSPAGPNARTVLAPLHYEPNYAYPLLIWLHGHGGCDERQLLYVMPLVNLQNFVAVAPRGFALDGEGAGGWDWPQTPECIEEAECRVDDAISGSLRRFRIARHRVFIAGFGAGGTMALRLAWRRPRRFAGAISLCGAAPRGMRPIADYFGAREVPVLIAVGRDDEEYTPVQACDDLRFLHTVGINIVLRQYPCAREMPAEMLGDVNRWLIDIVNGGSGEGTLSDGDVLQQEA
ncbi:MAG: alpha/beta hydrolase [Thermogutta sp.]